MPNLFGNFYSTITHRSYHGFGLEEGEREVVREEDGLLDAVLVSELLRLILGEVDEV